VAYGGRAAAHYLRGDYVQAFNDYTALIQCYLEMIVLNPDNAKAKLDCAQAYRKRYLAYQAAPKSGGKVPFQDDREEDERVATMLEKEAIAKKGENVRLSNGNTIRQEINRLAAELRDLEKRHASARAETSFGAADKPTGRVWLVNKTRDTVLIEIDNAATYRIGSGQERLVSLPPGKFTYRLAWESLGGTFGSDYTSEALLDRPRTLTVVDPRMPVGAASSMK
jgi:hypothetical protein